MASDELILSSEHPSPPGRTWTRGHHAGYNSRVITADRRGPQTPHALSGEYGQALVDATNKNFAEEAEFILASLQYIHFDTWNEYVADYDGHVAGFASGFAAGWDDAAEEAEFIIAHPIAKVT